MRILLIEDHADVAESVKDFLVARGHQVDTAGNGIDGLQLGLAREYDVVVVDRMLPGMDGDAVCSRLRAEVGVPVLMLTALTTTQEKLAGFAAGTDDYMTKPFDVAELEARMLALHRRAQGLAAGVRLRVADLEYNPSTRQATRGGRPLTLTPTGRRILEYLMRSTHRVVTRAELEQQVWGRPSENEELLRVHIHALRTAVDGPRARRLIHTVRGAGYRLALLDEA